MSDRVEFECNAVVVTVASGQSLLSALREELGLTSVKDGCAPQGQCGCCTVLVDGRPRVACVTPVARVAGRAVTTVEGLDEAVRGDLADAFCATGGSQCGFCTPGIIMRSVPLVAAASGGSVPRAKLDRALAAHLCRCTGWQTIGEAVDRAAQGGSAAADRPGSAEPPERDLQAAARRAELEGGVPQRVDADIPLGAGVFADDTSPRDAGILVAVPAPPDFAGDTVEAVGREWVTGPTLADARRATDKTQGRATTLEPTPPLAAPVSPDGGVALATCFVEPAYLEPDASRCVPGGEPATSLGNGGAFGGKVESLAPMAARELADATGSTVRVVYTREDTVRLGPKRPPVSATARFDGSEILILGTACVTGASTVETIIESLRSAAASVPYDVAVNADWSRSVVPGPPVSASIRATGLAETAVLVEGALDAAGADRRSLVSDDRVGSALLDTVVAGPLEGDGQAALAGASVEIADAGRSIERVRIRVAAGDPLDETVLRSYCIGAAHMALGWVLSEGLAVDPDTGEIHNLTIRSFGVLRARSMPPVDVEILDDPGQPLPAASDAVLAAVAGAAWNAVTRAEGFRPDAFPARDTALARAIRR
ncbi:MAG: 2Fe-2S iron-sulfur cluster-binding protein [Acidimicrobiia bacterium]